MSPIHRRIWIWPIAAALGACSASEDSQGSQPAACRAGQTSACGGAVHGQGGTVSVAAGGLGQIGSSPSGAAVLVTSYGGIIGFGGARATNSFAGGGAGIGVIAASSAKPICSPSDLSNFAYPAYKPARAQSSACTEKELESYFDECYSKGSCSRFVAGGESAGCGSCLAPVQLDASEYGPLIRLGSNASPLDITNTAGCIELVGEPGCAGPTMVAALCEYYACVGNCPATDAAGYQALMDCMSTARDTSCALARGAAVCIREPAHVTACSGTGFRGQFLAIARTFCAQGK